MDTFGYRIHYFDRGDFPVDHEIYRNYDPIPLDPNCHPEVEIHLVRKGSGQYFIGDDHYDLDANCVIIAHRNELHSYVPSSRPSLMIKHRLVFSAGLVSTRPSACTALRQLRSVHHLVLSDRQAILAELQLNNIGDECNNKHLNWQDIVLGQVEAFLITLNRAYIGQLEDRVCSDPMMQDVIKYLDDRFMETPSLEEVSDHFSLSSCGLSRRFKKYAGIGFRQYLIHRRIVEAKKMLEETDMKVTSIAYMVGFDSISSFNRDFHTLIGVSPAEYRRLSRGNRVNEL